LDVPDDLTASVDKVSFVNSVLNNLITNAVKFSERNSEIVVKAAPLGDRQTSLAVIDRGVGIPEPMLTTIFDLKEITTRAGTEGEEGTGFGMPLVQKFVHAFGGTIEVRSKDAESHPDDHGTEVIIILKR
jgi:signal transduction histidine kinase